MSFWRKIFRKKNKAEKKLPKDPLEERMPEAFVVTDILDLHGFFPEQVPEMIKAFLENANEIRIYTLRIIHGKGKSKLKWAVYKELEKYPQIARFKDAPPELGGWGSTIIYLKSEKQDEHQD